MRLDVRAFFWRRIGVGADAKSAPAYSQAEVNDIIKQKFLAELGKLLTFMYEEDRQTALAMYSKMFDDAADERDLVHFLISPTRQAVVIARAYNARVRKLQVESQSREQDGAEAEAAPDFVLAIDQLYRQYFPAEAENTQVLDDQFSLFEDAAQPAEEDAGRQYPELELKPSRPAAQEAAVPAAAEAPEEAAVFEQAPAVSTAEAVEELFDAAQADSPVRQDAVDSFLEDYAPPAAFAAEEELPEEAAPAYEEAEELLYQEDEPKTVRKPRVFLLILFVLLAVPITLAGVVLLLIPTLLFLALAAACVTAGAAVLVAAFSGFQILADFLLLFGAAVILLALGLLALWLFVWFIGGAIAGLISGVIGLGQSWCYKEVAA